MSEIFYRKSKTLSHGRTSSFPWCKHVKQHPTHFSLRVWHLSLLRWSEAAPPPGVLFLLFGVTAVWLGGMTPGKFSRSSNRSGNNDSQMRAKEQFIFGRGVAFLHANKNWINCINPFWSEDGSKKHYRCQKKKRSVLMVSPFLFFRTLAFHHATKSRGTRKVSGDAAFFNHDWGK